MCATLRHEIPEAVVTYEEKPREQWIFDYAAQVCGWRGCALSGAGQPADPGCTSGSPRARAVRRLPAGGAHVHPDLVDHGGGDGVRAAGGGIRERHQRLQQKAGVGAARAGELPRAQRLPEGESPALHATVVLPGNRFTKTRFEFLVWKLSRATTGLF